ncbi:hypothetical protein JJB99_27660 [Bradyrhizobium diazoefficiens]|uniref:hypothetical protein n=1 Tax=Bradyrhizobium diazoefficiens TaxID=1355477 RepID=UPI00190C5D4D|nr:hypothetical protein [Bradyrhizobium diazoefficiens]QQO18400.1 hypothetical protein JJB99_27660 [Bradyrhizobium diazoefficiens]
MSGPRERDHEQACHSSRRFSGRNQQDDVKTQKGKPLAHAKNEPMAEEIADRLNEQAYREEHEKWSP